MFNLMNSVLTQSGITLRTIRITEYNPDGNSSSPEKVSKMKSLKCSQCKNVDLAVPKNSASFTIPRSEQDSRVHPSQESTIRMPVDFRSG